MRAVVCRTSGLVLDQQDGRRPRPGGGAGQRRRFGCRGHRGLPRQQRKQDLEARALPGLAVHADVTPALGDDAVGRGQPQAGALAQGLGGEERLEQMRRVSSSMPSPVSLRVMRA